MGMTRRTITITEKQDAWINTKISAGDFADDSEYIRDLIRLDQARHDEIAYIRGELIKGEQSGEPAPFDFGTFKNAYGSQICPGRKLSIGYPQTRNETWIASGHTLLKIGV